MNHPEYSTSFLAQLYKTLYSIRVFETSCIQLYRQGLIRGYLHPYLGEEAIATGVCAALGESDYIVSTHRGHGHCIARGGQLGPMMAEIIGKETGYCRGRGGSMHIADVQGGNLGANGVVGAGLPIGVGAALASSIRGDDRVTVVFTSDGGANHGTFGESLNLAAIWDLPLIVVVENNQFAVSTPIEASSRETDLFKRGRGYGVESFCVDGNDVLEVYDRTAAALVQCREGRGPVLMEAKTYRQAGHHVNDPGQYMPADRVEHYKARDPIRLGRRYLVEQGGMAEPEVDAIEAGVEAQVEEAIVFARASDDPSVETFLREVAAQNP